MRPHARDGEAGSPPGSARVSRAGCGVPPQRTSRLVRRTTSCRNTRAKFAEAGRLSQQPGRLRYPERERLRRAQRRSSGQTAIFHRGPLRCRESDQQSRRRTPDSREQGFAMGGRIGFGMRVPHRCECSFSPGAGSSRGFIPRTSCFPANAIPFLISCSLP